MRQQSHPEELEQNQLGRWFTSVRRSGLLALVPAATWHTLSAVLSFTARDGRCAFTLDQLAHALGVSRAEADERLSELSLILWRDAPLAIIKRDNDNVEADLSTVEDFDAVRGSVESSQPQLLAGGASSLRARLERVGLNPSQAESLLARFPADRIARQLDSLPERSPRNPAAFLIRAVEGDWELPKEDR